jgi:hypothetical protein
MDCQDHDILGPYFCVIRIRASDLHNIPAWVSRFSIMRAPFISCVSYSARQGRGPFPASFFISLTGSRPTREPAG